MSLSKSFAWLMLLAFLFPNCKDWDYEEVDFPEINISLDSIASIGIYTARVYGKLAILPRSKIEDHGHCWSSQNSNPTVQDDASHLGPLSSSEIFESPLDLEANTQYFTRAYIKCGGQFFYSQTDSFSTLNVSLELDLLTGTANNTSYSRTTINGELLKIPAEGNITQYGHCYSSISTLPTISDEKTELGPTNITVPIITSLENLSSNTRYFARAYAIHDEQVYYGDTISFHSLDLKINTDSLVTVDCTIAAIYHGSISGFANETISDHGHCWSTTNPNPSILSDDTTSLGILEEPGVFQSIPDNLKTSQQYYVRSYAQLPNSEIIYGNVLFFTTIDLDVWSRIENNSVTSAQIALEIGGKAYVGDAVEFWEYHVITDTWTSKKSLIDSGGPSGDEVIAFAIQDKGYFCIFNADSMQNELWEYAPVFNTWTRKTDYPGLTRNGSLGFVANDKGYVGLGSRKDTFLNNFWIFDPISNDWSEEITFPGSGRTGATSFTLDGLVYLGLGKNSTLGYLNDFWVFDPNTKEWNQKNNFANHRSMAVGFAINGKGYIGTGSVVNDLFSVQLYEYAPSVIDQWFSKADFAGVARNSAIGFVLSGKAYLGFGENNDGLLNDLWRYTPE